MIIARADGTSRTQTLNTLLTQGAVALRRGGADRHGFGWLMAERALRPLARITETARRVAGRSLHERIALDRPARRDQGTRRHVRLDAGAAGPGVRQPAAVRR
jgi:hypothetical protein